MSENADQTRLKEFIALLGECERLSKYVEAFLTSHNDPQSSDVLFAVVNVKAAADRAAVALRVHVRKPH